MRVKGCFGFRVCRLVYWQKRFVQIIKFDEPFADLESDLWVKIAGNVNRFPRRQMDDVEADERYAQEERDQMKQSFK